MIVSANKVVNGEAAPMMLEQPLGRKANPQARLNTSKEFIMWDGEACTDTSYCLFGNSKGDELCFPFRLPTEWLINYLLDAASRYPKAFHFGYGFDYDVDNILWDLPKYKLALLTFKGKIRHRIKEKTYEISYIPRKSFSITELYRIRDQNGHYKEKRGQTIRIDDVVSYFNTRYDRALSKYKIGTQDELARMGKDKDNRRYFLWRNIEQIKEYWRLELRLGPPLMDKLRKAVYGAGFKIGVWYGPGAIAKYALRQHKMSQYMTDTPEEILDYALSAYAGGWFERFGMGFYIGPVYIPDIHSAYPWGISQLPNLQNGHWHYIRFPDPNLSFKYRLALFHINFCIPKAQRTRQWIGTPFPLFQRRNDGSIYHPMAVDNWYHSPEAQLVANDPDAEFLEAWVFEDDGTYPFDWVGELYDLRMALQVEGNAAEWGIKLGLNSFYGSMAQKTGWDRVKRHAPKWHQILWAGLPTSYCRNLVYRAATDISVKGSLLSIDTDGIIVAGKARPQNLPNGEGNQLGRWEVKEYTGILYVQNGVYWLRDMNGDWLPPKTRGIDRTKITDINVGYQALESTTYTLNKRTYTGFRHALTTDWSKRGQWIDTPFEFSPQYSGTRKHIGFACPECAKGNRLRDSIHPCFLFQHPRAPIDSHMHSVPWRSPDRTEEMISKFMRMIDEEES